MIRKAPTWAKTLLTIGHPANRDAFLKVAICEMAGVCQNDQCEQAYDKDDIHTKEIKTGETWGQHNFDMHHVLNQHGIPFRYFGSLRVSKSTKYHLVVISVYNILYHTARCQLVCGCTKPCHKDIHNN
jgi:hypothetical protein